MRASTSRQGRGLRPPPARGRRRTAAAVRHQGPARTPSATRRPRGRSGAAAPRWLRLPRAWRHGIALGHRPQLIRAEKLECAMAESPIVFDRALLRRRRRRALALGPTTFLLERVAEDFGDRLAPVLRRFDFALDLGTPGDAVRRALAQGGKVGTIVAADALARPSGDGALMVAADEEALPLRDGSFDLVVSALALQFVNDLPGTLVQIRRALKPDGL